MKRRLVKSLLLGSGSQKAHKNEEIWYVAWPYVGKVKAQCPSDVRVTETPGSAKPAPRPASKHVEPLPNFSRGGLKSFLGLCHRKQGVRTCI